MAELPSGSITVKINKTFREGMCSQELYEITRGIWQMDKTRRDSIKYVFAVANGEIKEVYEVDGWQDAGTDVYSFRSHKPEELRGRSEFVGRVADERLRQLYLGQPFKSYQVVNYFACRSISIK